jgi:four helix bundle protein
VAEKKKRLTWISRCDLIKIWWPGRNYRFGYKYLSGESQIPRDEIFVLTSQLRRAAVSVPSNIAEEGQGRSSRKEFLYFLGNAKGFLSEAETQILIARNLGYIDDEDLNALLNLSGEVGRILNGLLASLRNKK